MKKLLHLSSVFLLMLLASCASDQIEIEETNRANAVHLWHYNGDSAILKKVIEQLKNGSSSPSLERKLAKNDVLWNEAMFIYIENKKRILVPFLSEDKENVIGVLSLVKDPKGIAMVEDMTVRTRLFTKNNKLPFWRRGEWIGYFMALDKDILGIKNGNPGLKKKAVSSDSQKITGTICQNVPLYDVCTTYYDCETDDGGESMYNCQYYDGGCYTVYGETCWEVPEEPTDPGDGGGSNDNLLQILNYLTDKPLCVYNMLMNSNTGFNNLIKNFDGNFPVAHLQLQNSTTLPSNINAQTYKPENYLIKIEINSNNLSRPNLSIARTIIHEVIHAEMYRKILSILNNGGNIDGLTTTQWEQKLANGDYPGIFDYYSRYGVDGMDHELMAAHYTSIISDYLQELQPGLSQNIYDSLAWEGLKNTTAWNSLSPNQRALINNTISNFNNMGSENCN